MKKKILTILALTLCLLLCACGNDSDANTDKNSETTTDTSDVTTGTSETESETTDEPVDATVSGTWTDMFCIIDGHKVTFPCHWSDLEATGYVTADNPAFEIDGNATERAKTYWDNEWIVSIFAHNASNEKAIVTESPTISITGFIWEKTRTKSSTGEWNYEGLYCEDIMLPGGIKTTSSAKEVEDVYGKPDSIREYDDDKIATYSDETTGVTLEIRYDWYHEDYKEDCNIVKFTYKIDASKIK